MNKSRISRSVLAACIGMCLSSQVFTREAQGGPDHMAAQLRKLQAQGPLTRAMEVSSIDQEARTVSLAFSSETEYERWFGVEILGHDPGEIDLSRMQNGAALLMDHNWSDQIGVVESVSIGADKVGRAVVRFGRSERAQEIFQDVVDGIRKHISVGYSVQDWQLVGERDGTEIYRMTRWTPHEISFVAVPADPTVGVGRSLEKGHEETPGQTAETAPSVQIISNSRSTEDPKHMNFRTFRDAQGNLMRVNINEAGEDVGQPVMIERAGAERAAGADAERARVRSIGELADRFASMPGANTADLARAAIAAGTTVEAFQGQLLEAVNTRQNTPLSEQAQGADIGLTEREARNFSILRAVRALVDPTDKAAQRAAAFEFEASEAAARQGNKNGERFVIPTDVLRRSLNTGSIAGAGATGGALIANTLLASSFVDVLRNRATIMRMGSVLGGLVGNIDIPKQTAASQGYWLGEDDDSSETGIELGQIAMNPKTVAAFSEITRKMLQQSSLDAEALVRRDLAIQLALTIDKAGYYGTGSDHQPLGIANQTGINAVAFAGVNPTFGEVVDMETQIALDNADVEGMAYVGNAAFRGYAKTALKFPNAAGTGTIWEQGGTVNGYQTAITNQIASGDVFMGNFADLIIGMWGGLELTVDPYSNSKKGRLRLVVFQDVDFAVRRVQSFCLGRKPA